MEWGSTHRCLPSPPRETLAFWPIFPYSWKLLTWLPSPPLALSDSRFSPTLVRITFRSSAHWLSLGPLPACLSWAGPEHLLFKPPNQHTQAVSSINCLTPTHLLSKKRHLISLAIDRFDELMTNFYATHLSLPPKAHHPSSTPAVSLSMGSVPAPMSFWTHSSAEMALQEVTKYNI